MRRFLVLLPLLMITACAPKLAETCDNGVDDDGDGKVDCDDTECAAVCRERCTGGVDEDHDNLVDCNDPDCVNAPECVNGKRETSCSDGMDNDGDNAIDCADSDCREAPECTGARELSCDNGIDDDHDEAIDCADSDCNFSLCGNGCTCMNRQKTETACTDLVDNDGDGVKDCLDPDCAGKGECAGQGEICDDNRDNDGDRAVDCADPDCSGRPLCLQLRDGAACNGSNQCASGLCATEQAYGTPSGTCSGNCNTPGSTCSGGGLCVTTALGNLCLPRCESTHPCRAGYICVDPPDSLTGGAVDFVCQPLCSSDAECSRAGDPNVGCNPWSRSCELKNKGLPITGKPCTDGTQCESSFCLRQADTGFPGGYCSGRCTAAVGCGPEATCVISPDATDGVGICMLRCASSNECRTSETYECQLVSGNKQVCGPKCLVNGNKCSQAGDCCSGNCSGGICK